MHITSSVPCESKDLFYEGQLKISSKIHIVKTKLLKFNQGQDWKPNH